MKVDGPTVLADASIKKREGIHFPRLALALQFTNTTPVPIIVLIVSITKFSIVIGSPRGYWSRNRRAITCVSDLKKFKSDTCN